MNLLELREKEIFNVLSKLKNIDFVVIGGYAANVYALPRFSVDCDIVVRDAKDADMIEKILINWGYEKEDDMKKLKTPYHGEFVRFIKELENKFRVSFDILIGKIIDRQTGATLDADWLFQNSLTKTLKGKTITEKINTKVPTADALIIMKLLSCRNTDIRDIFMMITETRDLSYIKQIISEKTDFKKQFKKVKEKINSKDFKDNLQGVYGYIQEATFNKHKKMVLELEDIN